MDAERFDRIIKSFANGRTRRALLKSTAAAVAVAVGAGERARAAQVLRGPGQICRKNGDCVSGATCVATSTGRSVCTCGSGLRACGNRCITDGQCCTSAECDASTCQTCNPATNTCTSSCDLAANTVCIAGTCTGICSWGVACGYQQDSCAGDGQACTGAGNECIDCCCRGGECSCARLATPDGPLPFTCDATVHRCCCNATTCFCTFAGPYCCSPGDVCSGTLGICCTSPEGNQSCPAQQIFAVPR